MKIGFVIVLLLISSFLLLGGCYRPDVSEETGETMQLSSEQPKQPEGQETISVENASFIGEVAAMMADRTNNQAES